MLSKKVCQKCKCFQKVRGKPKSFEWWCSTVDDSSYGIAMHRNANPKHGCPYALEHLLETQNAK